MRRGRSAATVRLVLPGPRGNPLPRAPIYTAFKEHEKSGESNK